MAVAKTKKKQKVEPENLGTLDLGSNIILALPLPGRTKSVIVRYDNIIKVSCVIPAGKYTISISKRHVDNQASMKTALKRLTQKTIKAPSLILSHDYAEPPDVSSVINVNQGVSLYAYHNRYKDKSVIMGAPYLLSNVHSGGHICFGNMNPLTPREAFNTFWNSPFNNELLGEHEEYDEDDDYYYDDVKDYIDDYHDTVFMEQPWEDITESICGKKTWGCPRKTDALLVTANKALVSKIPRKYWRKFNNVPIVIARGNRGKRCWKFESGGFKFRIANPNVTFKVNRARRHY